MSRSFDDIDAGQGPEIQPPEAEGVTLPLNDIGNGRRFRLYCGGDVKRVSRLGWLVWDGRRWALDEEDQRGYSPKVRAMAHTVSARIEAEAAHIALTPQERAAIADEDRFRVIRADETDPAEIAKIDRRLTEASKARKRLGTAKREHMTFAKATGNSSKIEALLKEAAVEMYHPLDALDARPLDVNTQGGLLRFTVTPADPENGLTSRTAEVACLPHERAQNVTKLIPVAYDPEAEAPRFQAFLRQVQPDAEMRDFIARWFGLSMTAHTGEQKLAFFYGHGANGKSVLVDLIARLLGDYAATAKIETLTGTNRRGGGDATPDLVPLIGATFVRASEPELGTRLQEGTIKELTGGEPILVRALHSDFVEVTPRFKLTISGNHKPEVRGTDDGIWRRLLLVPFDVQIPAAQRDPDLGEKLFTEAPGILRWLVDGLIDYLENGLGVPQSITDATGDYRDESDPIKAFMDKNCECPGGEAIWTSTRDLVQAFHYWIEESGGSRWRDRTAQNGFKAHADRWRDPRTGLTYTTGKRSVAGYAGLRLAEVFKAHMDRELLKASAARTNARRDAEEDPF